VLPATDVELLAEEAGGDAHKGKVIMQSNDTQKGLRDSLGVGPSPPSPTPPRLSSRSHLSLACR